MRTNAAVERRCAALSSVLQVDNEMTDLRRARVDVSPSAPMMGWTPPDSSSASSCQLASCDVGVSATNQTESEMDATTVAVDLAKNAFEFAVAGSRVGLEQIGRVPADRQSAIPTLLRETLSLLIEGATPADLFFGPWTE